MSAAFSETTYREHVKATKARLMGPTPIEFATQQALAIATLKKRVSHLEMANLSLRAEVDAARRRANEERLRAEGLPSIFTARQAVEVAAAVSGYPGRDITGVRRERWVVRARFLAVWLCRRFAGMSLPAIGRAFKRDHTSIGHSIRQVEAVIARHSLSPAEDTPEAWAAALWAVRWEQDAIREAVESC